MQIALMLFTCEISAAKKETEFYFGADSVLKKKEKKEKHFKKSTWTFSMPIKSCNSESDWLPDAWTPWLLFYFPIQFNRRVQRRPKNVINEAGEALALRSTSQIKLVLPYIATIWADQRTSVLVLFGCSLKNQRRKKETFASNREREQKKMSPIPLCGHWSAGSDSSSRIKSPQGPEPTCSPYLFVQTSTKDNRKRFEPGVPRGPNLASSFSPLSLLSSYFFRTPFLTSVCFSLALFLLFPLKSPSSSHTTL